MRCPESLAALSHILLPLVTDGVLAGVVAVVPVGVPAGVAGVVVPPGVMDGVHAIRSSVNTNPPAIIAFLVRNFKVLLLTHGLSTLKNLAFMATIIVLSAISAAPAAGSSRIPAP